MSHVTCDLFGQVFSKGSAVVLTDEQITLVHVLGRCVSECVRVCACVRGRERERERERQRE